MEPPDRERESRPETERRDVDERDERDEAREDAREPLREEPESGPPTPPAPLPGTAIPVGVEARSPSPDSRLRSGRGGPEGATTGASPQVSQYSSPPPMSSYEPSHEGR
ncbi:hypothetical protein [Streptomyces zaomyceticus]|uniref:hypothetical protein n=1 Tax=Streptomyces zaomyceticus TaxID=68286 RepID=UPI003FA1D28C